MERALRSRRAPNDAKSRYLTPSRDISTSPSAAHDSDGRRPVVQEILRFNVPCP